jgi:hypothetical protein
MRARQALSLTLHIEIQAQPCARHGQLSEEKAKMQGSEKGSTTLGAKTALKLKLEA